MNDTMAFERALVEALEVGAPRPTPSLVADALAQAAVLPQRRPRIRRLDHRAWPPTGAARVLVLHRATRLALVAIALTAAVVTAAVVGAWLLNRGPLPLPDELALQRVGVLDNAYDVPFVFELADGRILAGGQGTTGFVAEVFDIEAATSERILVEPPDAWLQAIQPLPGGRFLFLVWIPDQSGHGGESAGQVFDPIDGSLRPTGPMTTTRYLPASVTLGDGRVLVAGGIDNDEATEFLSSVEVFDPETNRFAPAGSMVRGRQEFNATLLPDGRVLMSSGELYDEASSYRTLEIFDVATGTSVEVGRIDDGFRDLPPTVLGDGSILLHGSSGMHCGRHGVDAAPAWRFDPRTNAIDALPPTPHAVYASVPLPDGWVVVAGEWDGSPNGCGDDRKFKDAWIGLYDPRTGRTLESRNPMTGEMSLAIDTDDRYVHGLVLRDGRVALIAVRRDESGTHTFVDLLWLGPPE